MAGVDTKQGAVRKRQKIKESSRSMFMWVAAMSVAIGFALVVSWFLWKQIEFKTKVLNEKNQTVEILVANNVAAGELRDNIRVLETNSALNDSKADDGDKALQVILDALPSDANSLALGASLQQELTRGVSGLTIESLSVDPVADDVGADEAAVVTEDGGVEGSAVDGGNNVPLSQQITFRMVAVSRDINAHKKLLERFERSIRVIDIDTLRLEQSQNSYTMTLEAHAYYQSAKQVELREKAVTPTS